jgi:hypothetical protein
VRRHRRHDAFPVEERLDLGRQGRARTAHRGPVSFRIRRTPVSSSRRALRSRE